MKYPERDTQMFLTCQHVCAKEFQSFSKEFNFFELKIKLKREAEVKKSNNITKAIEAQQKKR